MCMSSSMTEASPVVHHACVEHTLTLPRNRYAATLLSLSDCATARAVFPAGTIKAGLRRCPKHFSAQAAGLWRWRRPWQRRCEQVRCTGSPPFADSQSLSPDSSNRAGTQSLWTTSTIKRQISTRRSIQRRTGRFDIPFGACTDPSARSTQNAFWSTSRSLGDCAVPACSELFDSPQSKVDAVVHAAGGWVGGAHAACHALSPHARIGGFL